MPAAHTTQGYAALTLGVNISRHAAGRRRQPRRIGHRVAAFTATARPTRPRTLDGMGINTMLGTGGGVNYYFKINDVMAQEVTITTDGQSAEYETGGIVTNIVPKDGGNRLRAVLERLVLEQEPSEQQLLRRTAGAQVCPRRRRRRRSTTTASASAGPSSRTSCGSTRGIARGAPSRSRPACTTTRRTTRCSTRRISTGRRTSTTGRTTTASALTWQVNAKNKLNYFLSYQRSCTCWLTGTAAGANYAPEASTEFHYDPIVMPQVTWSYARDEPPAVRGRRARTCTRRSTARGRRTTGFPARRA